MYINWFHLLIFLLVDAFVLMIAPQFIKGVKIKDFSTAFIVAVAITALSYFTAPILSKILNIATLGVFYVTGLGFILRTVVNAIIIEIVDQFSKGFNTKGFMPSLWLAVVLGLVGTVLSYILRYIL